MSIVEYQQESFYDILFRAVVFSLKQVSGLSRLWFFNHPSSVGCGFHLMEQTLTQNRHWLAIFTSSELLLPQNTYRQDRLQVKVFATGMVFTFLFWQLAEYLLYQRHQNIGVLASERYQLMSNELYVCCPQQWGPVVSLERATQCLSSSLDCSGVLL